MEGKMNKLTWLAVSIITLLAIVLVYPGLVSSSEYSLPSGSFAMAADNTTGSSGSVSEFSGGESIWDMFPMWVWIVLLVILIIVIGLIVFLVMTPPKKKKGAPGKPGKQQAGGRPGAKGRPMPMEEPMRRPGGGMGPGMEEEFPPEPGMQSPLPSAQTQYRQQPSMQQQPGMPQQPAGHPQQAPFMGQPPMPPQPGMQPVQQAPQGPQPQGPQGGMPPMQRPQGQQPFPQQPMPGQPGQPPMGQPGPMAQPRPPAPQPGPQQFQQPYPQQGAQQPVPPQQAPGQPQPQVGPRQFTPQSMPPQAPPAAIRPQPVTPQPAGMPRTGQPGVTPRFTAPSGNRPNFSVTHLNIMPPNIKQEDEVTISVTVTNTSSVAGQYSVVFRINHVVENISELTLTPGSSQTTSYSVSKEKAGEYFVEVDGLKGMFNVMERIPASFEVSELTITPERVKQSQPISISFIVTNVGERPGVYSANLLIKNITEVSEEIQMEEGETKQITFNIVKDTAGFYPVSLEGMTGRFVVEMDWRE